MAKDWIKEAVPASHRGLLHSELNVPEGETIPKKKIAAAAHSSNPTEAKRARLAQTLATMNRK